MLFPSHTSQNSSDPLGQFPDGLEMGEIISIYKMEDPSNHETYRTIVLLLSI